MTMLKFLDIKTRVCSSGLVALLVCCCLSIAYSANIGEMYFYTAAANGSQAIVKMDSYPETASGEFTLMGDGTYLTRITNETTGLGKRWIEPLQRGYLQVGPYPQYSNNGYFLGIRSITNTTDGVVDEAASHYFGSGNWHEGAVFMVVQPDLDWTKNRRNCLFSIGSVDWNQMMLQNDYGVLSFNCERLDTTPEIISKATFESSNWSTQKWYSIAVSWKVGEEPVLYVREMNEDKGPYESPDYVAGIVNNSGVSGSSTYTNEIPIGTHSQPMYEPLTIGAYHYRPGDDQRYVYGMGAKMAYYRLDDEYMSLEEIDEIFKGLYNPPSGTCVVIQ